MKFKNIKTIILFGGSRILAEVAKGIAKLNEFEVIAFSSNRHLKEFIADDKLLKDFLSENKIKFFKENNINKSKKIDRYINEHALGIAFGASWIFEKEFVKKFKNPLLDFMGIDLPRYRGGAHYSWQILFNNRKGCCNLQIIKGGKDTFHKGPIIKRKEYIFDKNCRLPIDYFNKAVPIERDFVIEFLKEIKKRVNFNMIKLNEKESTYYPFLHSLTNGWINWFWDANKIERFICAFDEPYCGASTRINKKRVFLKNATLEKIDKNIHPFSAGLVIHKDKKTVKVLVKGGMIKIEKVLDSKKKNSIAGIKDGDRFYSLTKDLEQAITFKAIYDAKGLKDG